MEKVIIVGAGLAGLSCAFELVEKGIRPLVLESRSVVGGRTSSWIDDGMPVESGLHRYLSTYDNLNALIRKAGLTLDDIIFWEDEFEIKVADGPSAVFGLSPVYNPFRTIWGFLNNSQFFNFQDKIRLFKFFISGLRLCRKDPLKLDEFSVQEYAEQFDLRQEVIHRFLVPLTAGLFFLPPPRYSAYAFFQVFVIAMTKWYKLRFGGFKGGMTDIFTQPIAQAIEARGGVVKTHHSVEELIVRDGRVCGVKDNQQSIEAQEVVLAVSLAHAQQLLKPSFGNEAWLQPMFRLPSMPAVTMHLELDKPAMPLDRTTFAPGTCIEAFSEQSRTTFPQSKGRLSLIIGPPEKFLNMPASEILEHIIEDAKRIGLDLAPHLKAYRKVAWPSDFYLLSPGTEKLRPPQKTPITGLTLAGDYTKQDFLASMEGATFSGKVAADIVINSLTAQSIRK